jgi:hypothetical protein
VDLDNVETTLELLRANAVVGVTGFFDKNTKRLTSIGIQCALCHSTVDDSLVKGIGRRLDGWPNRDLNIGAIVASAPTVKPFADLLGVDESVVRKVLMSWGPGRYDAELNQDGKAFRGDGKSAATVLPPAFGLAGVNLHTYTGWGSVTYWNAYVANTQMYGKGTFFDPRMNDPKQFPVAAKTQFWNKRDQPDLITSKLAALHFYQLAIPSPIPTPGVDFDNPAALRGDALFEGKAKCNNCHVEPLWTEPGWNLHTPQEMKIDAFQAKRAPVGAIMPNGAVNLTEGSYKTMNLAGIFVRELGLFMRPENKGRFYHDGRFQTLRDVVNSYNDRFNLGLTEQEKNDLIEYLKSL